MTQSTFPTPAADAPLGAVEQAGGVVRFTLYAPGRKSVHLLGDFNGFARDAEPMQPRDDGTWTVERKLGAGRHRYRFLVDGELAISDPYAREVEFEDGDPPREAYAVVHVGAEPYRWRHDFHRPPFEDLVIYEIAIGDFAGGGSDHPLRAIVSRLDHLQALGVNCIELMPVFGFATGPGWGYDPTHLFAVHPEYGSADDLRHLIDEAHGRGIAVVLDVVPAHTGTEHPFAQLFPFDANPYYDKELTEAEQEFGLPAIDYQSPVARRFIADVLRHWLEAYRVDGYRIDYLKLVGHATNDNTRFVADTCREVCGDCYLIGEHLPEDPQEINESSLSGAWRPAATRMLRAIFFDEEVDGFEPHQMDRLAEAFDPRNDGYDHATQVINYIESHDEDRLVHELVERGDDPDIARRKLALAVTLIATIPGEPMLYAGQEYGEDNPLNKETQQAPLRWEKLETQAGQGLFAHHQNLIRLRRDHPAIRSGHQATLLADNDARLLAFHRWNEEGDEVIVVANLSGDEKQLHVPLPREGDWREHFTGHALEVHEPEGDEQLTTPWKLAPWTAAIFVRP